MLLAKPPPHLTSIPNVCHFGTYSATNGMVGMREACGCAERQVFFFHFRFAFSRAKSKAAPDLEPFGLVQVQLWG